MLPSAHVEGLFCGQSLESFIEENLVKRGVLEHAFWDCRTASVDFGDDERESVQLGEVLGLHHDAVHSVDHFGRFG